MTRGRHQVQDRWEDVEEELQQQTQDMTWTLPQIQTQVKESEVLSLTCPVSHTTEKRFHGHSDHFGKWPQISTSFFSHTVQIHWHLKVSYMVTRWCSVSLMSPNKWSKVTISMQNQDWKYLDKRKWMDGWMEVPRCWNLKKTTTLNMYTLPSKHIGRVRPVPLFFAIEIWV